MIDPREIRMLAAFASPTASYSGRVEWTDPELLPILRASPLFEFRERGEHQWLRLTAEGRRLWHERSAKAQAAAPAPLPHRPQFSAEEAAMIWRVHGIRP